ncbi:MAG: glycosyl transferase [Clostridia bacterium]|jgi:glycosyltransferase involved in cell wall biosynthesis|nr:glycosyl transferase [Clostridia bacterium]
MDENVTAIIPAYNEEENISATICAVKQIDGIDQIIVVDDGSKDNTYRDAAIHEDIVILRNRSNKGKGGAIQAALPFVTNKFVILIDADLRESASEMKKLLNNTKRSSRAMLVAVYPKPIKKGGFGLVKGLTRKGLYMLTSQYSESALSGQRLVYTDFLRGIKLPSSFGLEFKITLEALKSGMNIVEVPVNIRHRETSRDIKGFLHRGKQFFQILNVLVRELV